MISFDHPLHDAKYELLFHRNEWPYAPASTIQLSKLFEVQYRKFRWPNRVFFGRFGYVFNSIILTHNWCWPFWVKIALLSWFFWNYQEEKNDWRQTQKQKYNMHSKIYQFQRNVSPKVTWKRGECAEPLPSKNMKGTRRWREYTTQWIRTPRKFPRQTSNLEHMCENMFWRHVSICYEHAAKMIWG